MRIKPEDAGLFELLDRMMDQGITFDAWVRVLLPTANSSDIQLVHAWTYIHFGELAA